MCPEDDILCAWVENNLPKEKARELEKHLNTCSLCFEKVFFLKKTLLREPLFIKEKESLGEKVILFLENQNVKIKNFFGKISVKPYSLAFRNEDVKKEAVLMELGGIKIKIETKEKDAVIILDQEAEIQLENHAGRIVFSGRADAGHSIYLDISQTYRLNAGGQWVTLEFKNVQ